MAKNKLSVPIWTKLVLAFLLFVLIVCGTSVIFVNIQYYSAEGDKVLPQVNGYRYCAVTGSGLDEKYSENSLLIVEKIRRYWKGDEVIVLNRDVTDQELVFNKRYILVRIVDAGDENLTGAFIAQPEETVTFAQYEVIGRVAYIIPGLGLLYDLMLGLPGILLFLLVPIVLTTIWIVVMVSMHSRRVSEPERYGVTEEDLREAAAVNEVSEELFADEPKPEKEPRPQKDKKNRESFDLFGEEPAELDYLRESFSPQGGLEYAFPQEDASAALLEEAGKEDGVPSVESAADISNDAVASASPLMDPLGKRAAMRQSTGCVPEPPAPVIPEPIPEGVPEVPEVPITEPEPNPLPSPPPAASPYMGAGSEEAVAIYHEDDAALRHFEPAYLNRNINESLEQLRKSLQESKRAAGEVDIVIGDQPNGLDEEKQRRLEQINSFNPDRIIAEIKRKNALYELSLRGENSVKKKPPVSDSGESPRKSYHAYPSKSANEFFQEHGGENLTMNEVAKLHQKDFDERRFRPSYITVVGEEENSLPSENSRFRNRNESDA